MKPEPVEKQLMTLDEEERKLLDSVENEEWISNYGTLEQFHLRKAELMKAARDTLDADEQKEIIIHIPRNVFHTIEILAEKSGIHYQNWIADTLQKAAGQ